MKSWRPIVALVTTILFSSLLGWQAEAGTWICWWGYPGRVCTIVKSAAIAPDWMRVRHRKPPPCPR
ncbi:MAG: hypothetical protein ACM30D_16105, partial [Hyphomicrobiales bacterium]